MEDRVVTPPGGLPPPPPRPARRGGIPLGRVAGVPVVLAASWLVLAVLVTVVYGGYVAVRRPELPPSVAYLIGFGLVLCLLVSVLLHELGHAVTARRLGIGVRGITLELLGGYTEMDRESPTPRVEAAVSLVGPAVSFVLGLLALGVVAVLPGDSVLREIAGQLAFSNLIVAVFNVLPGMPLDGGRALRAGIWAVTHDRYLGDRVAGWTGRVVAAGTVIAAVALYTGRILSWIGVVFAVVVALTLWTGATQSIRLGRLGERLPQLTAGGLARPLFGVPTGTPLAEATRRAEQGTTPDGRPPVLAMINSAGHLLGVVDDTAAAAVPPQRRAWVSVDAVCRAVDRTRVLPAELRGMQMLAAVQANPASEYIVTMGEDVVGVLRVADLMRVLDPRESPR